MADITISEFGLGFVRKCMEIYWGNCLFPLLFAGGLLWTLLRHRKKVGVVFFGYTVFLFLTAYNPFLVKYVIPKVAFEKEYYRLIWILPVIPGVAYYGVRLVFLMKKRWQRVALALALMGAAAVLGTPIDGIVKNFQSIENIYKIPNQLRAVCSVIHQDSEEEMPRVVFDPSLNSFARQYDASLELTLNRNALIYRQGSTVAGSFDETSKWYIRQKNIMDVIIYQEEGDPNTFRKALYDTRTDYLVVLNMLGNHEFIESAGCERIAETGEYVVYRFDWKKFRKQKS